MKKFSKKSIIILLFLGLVFMIHSCKKEEAKLPKLYTRQITDITQTTAVSGGTVVDDGDSPVTSRGICWSTNTQPTIADNTTNDGSGIGRFESNLTGLTENTIYYVRSYAVNSVGTGYGYEVSFVSGQLTDIDDNVYRVVKIGTQFWTGENLKTTKYNDGSPIPLVTDQTEWDNLTTPGYCWYNNDEANKNVYGALYNWYTVNTGNLCPTGWHVPTDEENTTLITFAGGESVAGGKLKEKGTTHWLDPNSQGTDDFGFTALPAGFRGNGIFDLLGYDGGWWTSTELDANTALLRDIWVLSHPAIERYNFSKKLGYSVRCVKD
jgi:uncharacterized protein (TIGR02145 family)